MASMSREDVAARIRAASGTVRSAKWAQAIEGCASFVEHTDNPLTALSMGSQERELSPHELLELRDLLNVAYERAEIEAGPKCPRQPSAGRSCRKVQHLALVPCDPSVSWASRSSISACSACQRRARDRSATLVAAPGSSTAPGREAAHARMRWRGVSLRSGPWPSFDIVEYKQPELRTKTGRVLTDEDFR